MSRYEFDVEPTVGVFMVLKSDDISQRIIFDTRVANTFFEEPAGASLPSAGAFATVAGASPLHFSQGDIASAFYVVGIPADLGRYFALPRVSAGLLGLSKLHGQPLPAHAKVTHCFL